MKTFKEIVLSALGQEASDIHLTCGMPPIYRIDGVLVPDGTEVMTDERMADVLRQLTTDSQIKEMKSTLPLPMMARSECAVMHSISGAMLPLRCVCYP